MKLISGSQIIPMERTSYRMKTEFPDTERTLPGGRHVEYEHKPYQPIESKGLCQGRISTNSGRRKPCTIYGVLADGLCVKCWDVRSGILSGDAIELRKLARAKRENSNNSINDYIDELDNSYETQLSGMTQ